MRVAIAAIMKNEAACLLDWLAFHRAVGIREFVIIDNGSTDGTWSLLKRLRRRGLVRAFRFPTLAGEAPQTDAYQAALMRHGRHYDVMAFLDADEYLMPTDGAESVVPAIEALFAREEVSAAAINWACFGSSGEVFVREGTVPERFVDRARQNSPTNHQYKSLVRPEQVVRFFNPHQAWLSGGHYVAADGEPLQGNEDEEKKRFGFSREVSWHRLRVNHYVVKSLEEFLVRKSPAGSAARAGKIKHRRFFKNHDFNDECDRSALDYHESMECELAYLGERLAQPAGVERLQALGARLGWGVQTLRLWLRRWRLYGAMRLRHGPLSTRDYIEQQDKTE